MDLNYYILDFKIWIFCPSLAHYEMGTPLLQLNNSGVAIVLVTKKHQ